MPIRLRTLSTSTSGSVISMPSTKILPDVGSSSRLTQRSSVDLPEPDGPIDAHHLAVVDVEVDALEHLVGAEGLVEVRDVDRRRGAVGLQVGHQRALSVRASIRRTRTASGTVIIR